jgi:hypothetical protein
VVLEARDVSKAPTTVQLYRDGAGEEELLPAQNHRLDPSTAPTFFVKHLALQADRLHFQASLGGVTYRVGVEIVSECPESATLFECARQASMCSIAAVNCTQNPKECDLVERGEATIVYDPSQVQCALDYRDSPKRHKRHLILWIVLAVVLSISTVSIAALIIWLKVTTTFSPPALHN